MDVEDVTQALARRALESAARWREAEGRARQCLLDWFGVVLASHASPDSAIGLGPHAAVGATQLLSGRTGSPADAALLNSMHAHQLDFDDFHLDVPGHASVTVIGAALAVAEAEGADLGRLLQAIVCGVEASTALGRSVGAELFERGWHPTAVLGAIGAAAAAAVVLELDERQLSNAIGLAALQASGTMAGFGGVGKSWQVGCAARDGVQAAYAAKDVVGSLPDHLGGKFGVLSLMSGRAAAIDGARDGGTGLSLADTQFKYYSACFGTHAAINATRMLVADERVRSSDVDRVEVEVGPSFEHVVINEAPATTLAAKFSVSAVVALTLMGRPPVVPDFFEPDIAASPEYRRLETAVQATRGDAVVGGGAVVRLVLRDGRVLERAQRESVPQPVDEAWTPLVEKFVANASPTIGDAAGRLAELVREAEPALPVSDLVAPIAARSLQTTQPTPEMNGAIL